MCVERVVYTCTCTYMYMYMVTYNLSLTLYDNAFKALRYNIKIDYLL